MLLDSAECVSSQMFPCTLAINNLTGLPGLCAHLCSLTVTSCFEPLLVVEGWLCGQICQNLVWGLLCMHSWCCCYSGWVSSILSSGRWYCWYFDWHVLRFVKIPGITAAPRYAFPYSPVMSWSCFSASLLLSEVRVRVRVRGLKKTTVLCIIAQKFSGWIKWFAFYC